TSGAKRWPASSGTTVTGAIWPCRPVSWIESGVRRRTRRLRANSAAGFWSTPDGRTVHSLAELNEVRTYDSPSGPPVTGSRAALGRTFSSLHNRNYRFYFAGQSVSLVGTWMQSV